MSDDGGGTFFRTGVEKERHAMIRRKYSTFLTELVAAARTLKAA